MPNREARGLVYCFQQKADAAYDLYLYDVVTKYGDFNWETWQYEESETSAKYFLEKLSEIPDSSTINLHINSQGGEVGEGVTIYNLLKQKSQAGAKIIGYIDGMAYSVAADIAMACDEIHMGLGTSMLLHYPWSRAVGNAEQLRQVADQLDALGEASVQLYMSRAKGLTDDEMREMMRKETMMDPEMCLRYGFCDVVDTYKKAEEDDPDNDPDGDPNPEGDPADDPDDDKKKLAAQLAMTQNLLKTQQEINKAMMGLKRKPAMAETLAKAMQLGGE